MDNQVVKMLAIDQGKRFVFCCGLQIDLWTELSVKKWSKKHVLGGSGPPNRVEITRDPPVFSLAREYLEVGVRFSYTV